MKLLEDRLKCRFQVPRHIVIGVGTEARIVSSLIRSRNKTYGPIICLDPIRDDGKQLVDFLKNNSRTSDHNYVYRGIGSTDAWFKALDLIYKSDLHWTDGTVWVEDPLIQGVIKHHKVYVSESAVVRAGTILNTGCIIEHDCVIGEGCFVGPGAILCGNVKLGRGAFLGAGVVVTPGVTIGVGSIIDAGLRISRDVKEKIRLRMKTDYVKINLKDS